jgi:hypothetical protein
MQNTNLDFSKCWQQDKGDGVGNHFNYVVLFTFYIIDLMQYKGIHISSSFVEEVLEAIKTRDANSIKNKLYNKCGFYYNFNSQDFSRDNRDKANARVGASTLSCGYLDDNGKIIFESIALLTISNSPCANTTSHDDDTPRLISICRMLYNLSSTRDVHTDVEYVKPEIFCSIRMFQNLSGIANHLPIGMYNNYTKPLHVDPDGLVIQYLNYLIEKGIFTIAAPTIKTTEQQHENPDITKKSSNKTKATLKDYSSSDDECNGISDDKQKCKNFKCNLSDLLEKIKEHPYVVLFFISAVALLTGGVVAITTYLHAGTSLMLSSGLSFLRFALGFQISLLLGVVMFCTAIAGCINLTKQKTECCEKIYDQKMVNDSERSKNMLERMRTSFVQS